MPIMHRKILAVAFGTELSLKAVKEAVQLAKGLAASLFVRHVRSPMDIPHHVEGGVLSRVGAGTIADEINQEERKFLEGVMELANSFGVEAESGYVADLSPYKAIIRVAQELHCDLIVMGTRIHHGIPGYFCPKRNAKSAGTHGDPRGCRALILTFRGGSGKAGCRMHGFSEPGYGVTNPDRLFARTDRRAVLHRCPSGRSAPARMRERALPGAVRGARSVRPG